MNNIILNKMKQINPKVKIAINDSGYKSTLQANWMPGGTLSIVFGKWSNLVKQEETYKDPKGRWHTI